MKFRNIYKAVAAACLACSAIPGYCQAAAVQTLRGQVRPQVARGLAVPTSLMQPGQQMRLSIVLPLRNQTELKSLLGRLYDPSSPDYHKFLTAEQFTEQFAPTAADYQAVVAYAQSNGFTVDKAPANRLIVPITGTVAQVQKAFSVRMALYQHPTENRQFFSPDREPSLNLSVPVAHIAGLDNYSIPKPMYSRAQPMGSTHYVTEGSGPGGSFLASDMRWAYYGGTALTGAGQTVALLEFNGYDKNDVDMTFSTAGESYSVPIQNVLLDDASGVNTSGDDSEEVLDIVQVIGMAPGLKQVRVYIGGSDVDILNQIAADNLAQEVSISWAWSPDNPETDDVFFQEMAAQGQSVFAASGDWGAFDPAFDYFFPAEDDFVTAVGGTDLDTQGGGGPWASETAWVRSGGGVSPDGIPIPAWQAGIATSTNGGSTTLRNVPDVAMQADFTNYGCTNGTCAGNYGGTSLSAPRWAAFMALVNEQAVAAGNTTVGFINPALYAIGQGSNYADSFHDVTLGNNNARNNCCGWPSYNAVPGYDLVTGWGSPNGQAFIDQLAPPAAAPGFTLAASASLLTVTHGNSGSVDISVTDRDGFTGSVTLSAAGLPAGVTAAWGTNPTPGGSRITLQVGSSVNRGSYLITVNGVSGSVTASTSFVLQVSAPGFSIAPSPANLTVYPGTSTSASVLITDYTGFNGAVNLAVTSGLPSGVTASWSTNPATSSAVLTLTADSTAVPNTDALLTITGTSGSLSSTTSLALVVNQPTLSINMSPYPSTIVQGGSLTTTVTVSGVPANRTTDTITLSAPALPAGVTASFNPTSIQLGQSSNLTLTASASAPTGSSIAVIDAQGTSEGTVSQFPLTVTASASPSFTLGVSQAAPTVVQGGSASDTVSITAQNGFNSAVTLALSPSTPLPGGVTASFSPSTATTSSQLTFTATNSATAGFYPLQIVGTSGSLTAAANIYLTVNPPALFTLIAAPASASVTQYGSATNTITINPQTGFTGSVKLSVVSALPAGVTATISPSTTSTSSTLTLTATGTATIGNSSITIAGVASGHTVTMTMPLTVLAATNVPTTTALSIAPTGPLPVGSGYTLYAHVAPASGSSVPTGSVIFNIGGASVTVGLDGSGNAIYTGTAPSTAGTLAIAAAYQGSNAFAASSSNTLNVSIIGAASTTALTISPGGGSLTVGSSFTLTATVTPQSGSGTPTGNVIFRVGSAQYTVALSSGVATYTGTAPGSIGTLSISAAYQGSSDYAPSTSVTLHESIAGIATATTVSIIPTGGSLVAGSSFTVTAIVTAASGTATPTGSVRFTIGSSTQTATLDASGSATVTATAPATPGTLAISAAYLGASAFAPSTSVTVNELIGDTATTTVLAISPNASSLPSGSSFTLTATVTAQTGTATPTGTVIFTVGSTTQSVTLTSGVATYTANAPAVPGALPITATYQGQGGFAASTSATLNETVYAAATPAFALTGTAVTLVRGATTGNTSTITITPSNGFTGGVTLTASMTQTPINAQDAPTFHFATSPVTVSGSTQATTQLIISTTASTTSASNAPQQRRGLNPYTTGGAALACLLLFGIPARRRAWQQRFLALAVLAAALAGGTIGCSSSFKLGNTNPGGSGTTPGLYIITINGASGSTTATTTVSVTVE